MVAVAGHLYEVAREEARCRKSLWHYTRCAWKTIDPAKYVDNFHIGAICEHLQAITNKQITKLIINCPPGLGKSSCVSVFWPSWEWVDHPGEQSLFGSYDPNLALRDSVKCRTVIESEWYQEIFQPTWRFSKDQNAKGFYTNTLGGNRYTFGLGTGTTGWRGNKVVLDDPNSIGSRFDARVLKGAYETFNNVVSTRVNDLVHSAFVIIQQRMSTIDMTGCLLSEDEDYRRKCLELGKEINESSLWVHLKLPMTAPKSVNFTRIGWKDPRQEGELLFPARIPQEIVDYYCEKKLDDGGAGQFQQEPIPEGGSRFNKNSFLHWYDLGRGAVALHRRGGVREVVNLNLCLTFVSVDLAASEKTHADWTVFEVWAVTKKFDMLLLNVVRGRMTEPDLIDTAVDLYAEKRYNNNKYSCFIIEDNGLGLPITQGIQARGIPVLPVHIHRTDKFVRSATAAIRVAAGQIFFPDPSTPWYSDPREGFEVELTRFPGFDHDDQVDAFSLAAEGVYEAGVTGMTEFDTLPKETKTAVEVLENRNRNGSNQNISQRFFGRR